MNIALIIIFLISVIACFGMLFYKSWQIRVGHAEMTEKKERAVVSALTFVSLKNSMLYYAKRLSHIAIILVLRFWVWMTHSVSKLIQSKLPKIEDGDGKTNSQFLKTISTYKNRIKRMRERIKEKEETKEENKVV
jgi:hypothetical protein